MRPSIRNACKEFILLCRKLDLLTDATVAIDSSKFKAANNRDKTFTQAKLQRRIKELEENIAGYLVEMDTADRQEPETAELRTERLKDKIAALKEQLQMMHVVRQELSNHAKLIVKFLPNALKMELTSLRSSSPFKLQNLRQKYLACFQRISILLSSGLYGGR